MINAFYSEGKYVNTIINAKQLTLQYDSNKEPIIKNFNLSVGVNEFIILTGNSGSGKTTILKSLYGDLKIKGGSLNVCGINLVKANSAKLDILRHNMGIIFQDYRLIDDWNIEQNVMLPLRIKGLSQATCLKQTQKLLAHVKLLHKSKSYPYELSGGEQQRVAIARAIGHNPLLILADEPTGNLDSYSSEVIMNLLQATNKYLGATVVVATHHLPLLHEVSYKHYVLNNGVCIDHTDHFI